jgi:hypothetical protein
MPKRIAALAAVLVLTLSGCAGAAEDAGDVSPAPSASESAAPLTAETPDDPADDDEAFLAYVRENLAPATQIPDATDAQLIAAGEQACEQLESGVAHGDVRVVDGEVPNGADIYADSSAIMNGAVLTYCPAFL